MPIRALRSFIRWESSAGLILMSAAILSLLIANSSWAMHHAQFFATRTAIIFGEFAIDKPLLLWINDGLMAVFFLLIGLELKREVMQGQLATRSQLLLPVLGATGGFVLPAVIFYLFNRGDPIALAGWAIPSATDIAFALGVLSLFGSRIPLSVKVFLASIAIVDDVGAIIVIALFYTSQLSVYSLLLAAIGTAVLVVMNLLGVRKVALYIVIGVIIWAAVLKSGIHATLAGIIVAMAIPISKDEAGHSPLVSLEHSLHPWIAFAILPLFAFANAGVSLLDIGASQLFSGVSLGIAAGLFFGKQIGVFVPVWLAIKSGLVRMPEGANWLMLYGVAVTTGIGFTMSFFIGTLAFEYAEASYATTMKIGVLTGSALSMAWALIILAIATRKTGTI